MKFSRALWRARNRERIRAYTRRWQAKNRDRVRAHSKKWEQANPAKARQRKTRWRRNNLLKARESWCRSARKRRATPEGKIIYLHRSRVQKALAGLRKTDRRKTTSSRQLLGCSLPALKRHIESMFQPGMTWKNWGRVWHLDHIIPIAAFDLRDARQRRTCFRYSNLQPLFKRHNLAKGDKFSIPHE